MKKYFERIYRLSDYDSICPEERKRILAPYIVADTLLAVNRLLLAQGIGLQITMQESSDGDDMYCAVRN
ncbi:MAG: hypothetical protein RQ754_08275 [Desulfuromonadales bacterium]|nr:hypothetical protein [Desulfuromonadales bacterium]